MRERLHEMLHDPRLDTARLIARLREARTLEAVQAFRLALFQLTHLDRAEADAEGLIASLLRHRDGMVARLGRDPGLQVAAIDFLTNVRPLMRHPTVVEWAQLEETERFAVTDPLTDLYNRRYFDECFEREIARSRRHGLDLALLMLDLDSFKSVNDLYGHPLGDRVLRRAGHLLRRALRESDSPCRYGGEEFAVILPETDRLGAHVVAERVRKGLEHDFAEHEIDGRLVAMTVSGGIACFPDDGDDASTLIGCADLALYASKRRGRNRIVIFHGERRRAVRYPFRPHSRATLARPSGEPRDVAPLNLSLHGALVKTGEAYAAQDPVELTLYRHADLRRLPGRVVRVESDVDGDVARRVAVQFSEPLDEDALSRHARRGPLSVGGGA